MKRIAMLLATLLAAVLLASGAALALTEVGGPGHDTLTGTDGTDRLDGRAGRSITLAWSLARWPGLRPTSCEASITSERVARSRSVAAAS